MNTAVFDLYWLARLFIITLFSFYLIYDFADLYKEFKELPEIVKKWVLVHLLRQRLGKYIPELLTVFVLIVIVSAVIFLQIYILYS